MHNIPQQTLQLWLKYAVYHMQSWFSKILQLRANWYMSKNNDETKDLVKIKAESLTMHIAGTQRKLTDCSKRDSMVALVLNTEQWGSTRWQLSRLHKKKRVQIKVQSWKSLSYIQESANTLR